MNKYILEFDGIIYDGSNLEELEIWLSEEEYERADNWSSFNLQYKNEGRYTYIASVNEGDIALTYKDIKDGKVYSCVLSEHLFKIKKEECNQPIESPIKLETIEQVNHNNNNQIVNRLLDIIEKVVTK